jgi:hypothetical protein
MLRRLLSIEDGDILMDVGAYFRQPAILLLLVIAVAAGFAFWLYRRETDVSQGRRMTMMICQGLAMALLGLILLEPVLDLSIVRPLQRTLLILVDSSASMALDDADDGTRTRYSLATKALQDQVAEIEAGFGESVALRYYRFDETLTPTEQESLAEQPAEGEISRVGSAIEEAVARHAGQPLAGVVVLSDFAWAKGEDPSLVASRLKDRGVPVFSVAIGQPSPPDLRVRRVIAPDVAFAGDRVPIRVQLSSSGYEGRDAELTLSLDGDVLSSQHITLSGGAEFAELTYAPQKDAGDTALKVAISALEGETGTENNSHDHHIRVIDDKIKVLYVEGHPRWEYRYLRWVLLRDPRLSVTFLMTQGDPTLASVSPQHIARFPDDPKVLPQYDLVILGDIPATYFKPGQLESVKKLVQTSGGSLLMLAGPIGAPSSYGSTPIEAMLPVELGGRRWRGVGGVHPVVTADGQGSPVTSLATTPSGNARLWAGVRPMDYLADLKGAKPGATTLLTLSGIAEGEREYPLVAWQRFGNGKVMYVGTEDLWRMRLEVGDRYHARFWGQTIQFLALSRLLGENKPISLETDRRDYATGDQVRIFANVLTEAFEPIDDPIYTVLVERQDDVGPAREIELSPVVGSPGLYSGMMPAREDGRFLLRARDADAMISNRREFTVRTIPMEMRETAMQLDVARRVAKLSGGRNLSPDALKSLPEIIEDPGPLTTQIRKEADLWDLPIVYLLALLLVGIEWYLRRRDNLV